MKQHFIEKKGPLSKFRLSLFRTGEQSPSGNKLYREMGTGIIWEKYEYEINEPLRIITSAYRAYPYAITSELIAMALYSPNEVDIKGACRLLFHLEFRGKEYRLELIEYLENTTENLTSERFDLIYEYANLANQGNLRETTNKSAEQVSSDFAFYQELYCRGQNIKENIITANKVYTA